LKRAACGGQEGQRHESDPPGLGLVLAISLAAAASAAILVPAQTPAVAPLEAVAPSKTTPLPATNSAAWPSLVDRSPFVVDRSAFSRNAGPPAHELKVRLAGIFKVGVHLRANLVVGNDTLVVVAGDDTPAGVVESIEPTAVVVAGQKLELFK
jgi:hypothetical protein